MQCDCCSFPFLSKNRSFIQYPTKPISKTSKHKITNDVKLEFSIVSGVLNNTGVSIFFWIKSAKFMTETIWKNL